MATIITVHGTFATGPDEGDKWWQRGSEFERDVREFVEAEDGALEFKPFVWDGLNSEVARRRAGRRLWTVVRSLPTAAVIWHSHGGSVIANMVVSAPTQELATASRLNIVTVGTPFIVSDRKSSYISKLRLIPLSLFLTSLSIVATLLFVFVATMLSTLFDMGSAGVFQYETLRFAGQTLLNVFPASIVLISLMASGSIAEWRDPFLRLASRKNIWRRLHRPRSFFLYHPNDEAINGLKFSQSLKLDIVQPASIVPPLSLAVVPLVVLCCVLLLLPKGDTVTGIAVPIQKFEMFVRYQAELMDYIFSPLGFSVYISPAHNRTALAGQVAEIVYALISYSIIFIYILGVVYLWLRCVRFASPYVSAWANTRLARQIASNVFGSDEQRERSVDVAYVPPWIETLSKPLPDELATAIESHANGVASRSIAALRTNLGALAFGQTLPAEKSALVLGEELIHTSYFSVGSFRKLVCYAIAHSPGFRPSDKLKGDPDYERLGQWLQEIQSGSTAAVA